MTEAPVGRTSVGGVRDAGALTLGTAINGVMAYVFFAIVTRVLGADDAAPVAVLWTYWGAATAVVTFPVQHWIIRTLHAGDEAEVAATLRRVVPGLLLVSVAVAAACWSVAPRLFRQPGLAFPVLTGVLTAGTLFAGIVRGGLAGRGRFVATAGVIAGENTVRVLALVVVLAVGFEAVGAGVVLVAGSFVGIVLPTAWRFRHEPGAAASPTGFLGSVALGSLISQLVLVGGPAIAALLDAPADRVTSLFVTLAVFRAPYLLGVGLANQATAMFTRALQERSAAALRRAVEVGATGTVGVSVVAGAASGVVGPGVVGLVFGAGARPSSVVAATVAAASVLAVGNLALALVEIASGTGRNLTRAWVAGVVVAGAAVLVVPASPTGRVVSGLVAGEAIAFVWLVAAARTRFVASVSA